MIRWTPALKDRFAEMYEAGKTEAAIMAAIPGLTRQAIAGQSTRMQLHRPARPGQVRGLRPDHDAVVAGRTIFPTRVRDAFAAPALLTPGAWQRKLGAVVEKGAWKGMPIFALTLEERATCPADCHNWLTCMGNGMQAAWRNRHGAELEEKLEGELAALQDRHPAGFVVRLHILGDFYSEAYVDHWEDWLDQFPALHVFGYSARDWLTPIGAAVGALSLRRWDRFAVRLSAAAPGILRAVTLRDVPRGTPRSNATIICPAQTGATAGCNTCGLCWSPAARRKTIGFVMHGPTRRRPA